MLSCLCNYYLNNQNLTSLKCGPFFPVLYLLNISSSAFQCFFYIVSNIYMYVISFLTTFLCNIIPNTRNLCTSIPSLISSRTPSTTWMAICSCTYITRHHVHDHFDLHTLTMKANIEYVEKHGRNIKINKGQFSIKNNRVSKFSHMESFKY